MQIRQTVIQDLHVDLHGQALDESLINTDLRIKSVAKIFTNERAKVMVSSEV